MAAAQFGEHVASRASTPASYILKPLADRLVNICTRRGIEQSLVRFRVLHHSRRLSVDGQDNGSLALLQPFQELAGVAPKIRQRLDVLGYVQHSATQHLINN